MKDLKIQLPNDVKVIISQLNKRGFEAFSVGGCVRDSLLGLNPNDWDICTNARPDEIKECFKSFDTFDSGIKHGTISVVYNNSVYEVTTYRIDGEYTDNRHPESVEFTTDIVKDLARRDFTVNAIAYNEASGIVDPYGGIGDLDSKTIKCVGEPDKRFNEDALRILRALRFAAVYDFIIDSKTAVSIKNNAYLLKNIAYERINAELDKLLCGNGAENILNEYKEVFSVFIPELKLMFDFDQHSKHHSRDLWSHTTHSVKIVKNEPLLKMTMLLHDLGKPHTYTVDGEGSYHFSGHQAVSAEHAKEILHKLKYPSKFIADCIALIKYHDVRFNGSKKQLKRMLNKIGEKNTRRLLEIQKADIKSQSEYMQKEKLQNLCVAHNMLEEIIKENECFSLKQLAINGLDIILLGITEGKQIGIILNSLMNKVIDGELKNKKEVLLDEVMKEKVDLL